MKSQCVGLRAAHPLLKQDQLQLPLAFVNKFNGANLKLAWLQLQFTVAEILEHVRQFGLMLAKYVAILISMGISHSDGQMRCVKIERMSKDNALQNHMNMFITGARHHQRVKDSNTTSHIPSFLAGKSKFHNLPRFTVLFAFCFGHIM